MEHGKEHDRAAEELMWKARKPADDALHRKMRKAMGEDDDRPRKERDR